MNQEHNFEEMKDPHLGKAITGGRQEAPTGEMNSAKMNGLITSLMTITRMISEGKAISPTKPKISGGMMDTPIKEALEGLLTMIGMNVPES